MKPDYERDEIQLYRGDCLKVLQGLQDESVHCVVTSPPYWNLRNYKEEGQYGLESTLAGYIDTMLRVFTEVRRVLKKDGTLWLNMGDCYSNGLSSKTRRIEKDTIKDKLSVGEAGRWGGGNNKCRLRAKNLIGVPWRIAFALQSSGWILRSDIIWAKPNPMPSSVTDRPTTSHEYIFLFSKSPRYYYDYVAIREPAKLINSPPPKNRNGRQKAKRTDKQRGHSRVHAGFNKRWDKMTVAEQRALGSNKRDVWTVATHPFPGAHYATYPPKLIEPCILAGCPKGGIVLDPFLGSGTTLLMAIKHGCGGIGIDLNIKIARKRIDTKLMQGSLFDQEITIPEAREI